MKRMVVDSAKWQHGDTIPVMPFRLDVATENAPTEFEVTFVADRVRYQYGYTVSHDRIHEEWLFAYPHGRPQKWLGRVW
ncbi:AAA family ATPase [Fluviibacter phosphoraccumulans]|nr:AAA family ATPase [Fluviibacter phosphoraccumulans]